ncbi:MAG UNVERIFIED_CONTAM: DUF1553 domain-containing protein [Planctomycetaceae bacterium]|jgi:hypothetical protein
MVNRIWLHLMGEALVRETDNFGASGPKPSNQALLDYLAVRFVDSGWSVKTLIREIMLSRVYRLSSEYNQQRFERDPENQYFAASNCAANGSGSDSGHYAGRQWSTGSAASSWFDHGTIHLVNHRS